MSEYTTLTTKLGLIKGLDHGTYHSFLGIPFATAGRFEYGKTIDRWEEPLDATSFGPAVTQYRTFQDHLDIPERRFYYNEFRQGIDFTYQEDSLNLNLFTPKNQTNCPVIVFIHGGGFNSGSCYDSAIQGDEYAKRGLVFVSIQYRVGPLGYFTHESLKKEYGREGNFGVDDQFLALTWVKTHIADFGGDPDNITVMGQSAGAISIQLMCLSEKWKGLFRHAIMMSGAGAFPSFAQPRPAQNTHEYWIDVMATAGCKSFEEFKVLDVEKLFEAWEKVRSRRKDNTYNTMPVIDGYYLTDTVSNLIQHPLPVDYMVGYTNNDMYAPILAHISNRFSKENGAYLYYFDIDAPGDGNKAFHSADIRYLFGTLSASHRPYDRTDQEVSHRMLDYVVNFATTGNPNLPKNTSLPDWSNQGKALHITRDIKSWKHIRPSFFTLTRNWLKIGDPK